ncbi:unnamed protein product [Rotaria sordida]|uniref:Uncharacterized protein n=1 Tax=Rotaria sordida TaxID=392033 RepID=A0A816F2U6_9BILA|nr:unnamed protein product [Rotaria sordida]CAF1657012.1 unnamed protein product [Rotaria sordida]
MLLSSISTQSKSGEFFIFENILTSEEKKIIKGLLVNAIRSNINKTTNDSSCVSSIVPSNRLSIQNSHSKASIVNNVNTKQKQN